MNIFIYYIVISFYLYVGEVNRFCNFVILSPRRTIRPLVGVNCLIMDATSLDTDITCSMVPSPKKKVGLDGTVRKDLHEHRNLYVLMNRVGRDTTRE